MAQQEIENNGRTFKRGDIFHDGLLCYWVIHEKPNGRKLFIVPLEEVSNGEKSKCDPWHNPGTWDLSKIKVRCNLYDNPEKSLALLFTGNSLKEKLLAFALNAPNNQIPNPMSKDLDLNRDVQNELNQIFPEMTTHEDYHPNLCGILKGALINTIDGGLMDLRSAKILRESLSELQLVYGDFKTDANNTLMERLNKYIEQHDKTAH